MARGFTPKVLTANDLLEGVVIYRGTGGGWTLRHEEAELFTDELSAHRALKEAEGYPEKIVGAYLADAAVGADGPEPVHFREAFRTRGPSNYAHGKQVES